MAFGTITKKSILSVSKNTNSRLGFLKTQNKYQNNILHNAVHRNPEFMGGATFSYCLKLTLFSDEVFV